MKKNLLIIFSIIYVGCSPLKSSPTEEKHQLELTLHEIQTNIDDLRHDLNCFQTELQILDGKIKYQEATCAREKTQSKVDNLLEDTSSMQEKLNHMEREQRDCLKNLNELSMFSDKITIALEQHKQKIESIEKTQTSCVDKINQISKLKNTLKSIASNISNQTSNSTYSSIYKVKPGDSLDKIARKYKINVEILKSINNLDRDLIVVGQELKIP